jgi:ADP-heptose:LPS heptosyltransferase
MHAADFFLAQVGAPGPGVPQIRCPRVAHDFAVIHPFSAGKHKTWPLERFRAVARAIEPVRWCAGPDEALEDAVRFDDLYQLACWLAGARVFVGNDSGIAHLAAAAGAPVVAIFGPTDPAIWAPRGDRVRIVHRPSLDEVPVEDVMDAAIGVAL